MKEEEFGPIEQDITKEEPQAPKMTSSPPAEGRGFLGRVRMTFFHSLHPRPWQVGAFTDSKIKTPKPSRLPMILAKAKNFFSSIKKPKVITLIILALAIFVVYLTLNLVGQKQQENNTLPQVEQTQQSPPPPQDPSLANIAQRVESYGKKIDALDSYKKRLIKPIVDLEIKFE